MHITVGSGLQNPRGFPVEVNSVQDVARVLRECPAEVEAWWSVHLWEDNYRNGQKWQAAAGVMLDMDRQGHAALTPDMATKIESAAQFGDLPGSIFHMTPAGARVVFVFAEECRDRDLYLCAADGATLLLSRALRPELGVAIDGKPTRDLGRLMFTPDSIAKGVQRHADVVTMREEPYAAAELAALAPPPAAPVRAPVPARRGSVGDRVLRARAYVATMGASVAGQHGDDQAIRVAFVLVNDFELTPDEARAEFVRWNATCQPQWGDNDIARFLRSASKNAKRPRGAALDVPPRTKGNGVPDAEEASPFSGEPEEMPPPARLVPVRLSLDDVLYPPRESFILGRMVPRGKSSVLFGPSSVGKSAFAAQLLIAVAAGAESLWGLPLYRDRETEEYGGPVLVYTAEDTLDDWKRKAAAVRQGTRLDVQRALERLHIIDQTEGSARLSEIVTIRTDRESRRVARPTEEQDRVIEVAKEVGAILVLVETASRLVEEEDNASFSALQSALGRIGRETGAGVLVSHHATKAASKDNDSAIESARGGGALTMNSRNTLSLFPAEPERLKPLQDRFPVDDVVILGHGKASSSTRRQDPILLIRTGTDWGAVFSLPDQVALSPEQAERNAALLELERAQKWERMRRLYAVVEKCLPTRPGHRVTASWLRDEHLDEIGGPKNGPRGIEALVTEAVKLGHLKVVGETKTATYLGLGLDPRKTANEMALDRASPGESPEEDP